jgi:hypothetical protein
VLERASRDGIGPCPFAKRLPRGLNGFVVGATCVALGLSACVAPAASGKTPPFAAVATESGTYATRGWKSGRSAAASSPEENLFPLGNGWLGGDAAYSISLGRNRILWLFGDTFTDVNRLGERHWDEMVGNSVAVSEEGTMGWATSFYYGESGDGEALPFFRSQEPDIRYWPRAGFKSGETISVFLTKAKYTGVGPFGFEVTGSVLASFKAQEIGPATSISYVDLPSPSNFLVGSAVALAEDQILIYSTVDDAMNGGQPIVYLNRYQNGDFQYLAANVAGETLWKTGLLGDDALVVLNGGVSEFSVHYHQATGQWLMVYSDIDIASGKIWLRKARRPQGPWSDPLLLYTVDEVAGPNHVPFAFTYAAKAHPELETDSKLWITYVVNLDEDPSEPEAYQDTDLWRILKPAFYGFYVPQLVSVDVPEDE